MRGVKVDPQEIVAVYANAPYLSKIFGEELSSSGAEEFLINNAAYLLQNHIRRSSHELLPSNIKWVMKSKQVFLPEFHVKVYLQDNGFITGASRSMFLPVQHESGVTQIFDVKGVGSINPKDISNRDGILRADSGLRELFINQMVSTYLSIPSVRKNISRTLSLVNLTFQGVKIEHVECSGVIGLLFIPGLKTNVSSNLPSTNFGSLLIRPIQPHRIFNNHYEPSGINLLETLIFAPLGLTSDPTGPNIQGYVDPESNSFVLIDFGTVESGTPQTAEVSPPIFKNPLATDAYLAELSRGVAEGTFSSNDIEKILQHLKRWVIETFASSTV